MNWWKEADEAWNRERRWSGIVAGACIVAALTVLVMGVVFALVVKG